jgi:hypothetical protein
VAASMRHREVAADGRRAGGGIGAKDDGGRNNRWVFCFCRAGVNLLSTGEKKERGRLIYPDSLVLVCGSNRD